jgi:hypothetical protein
MGKQTKKQAIEKVAQRFVDSFNTKKTTSQKDKIKDIETVCNFGILGFWTPREISQAFYNSFNKNNENG